MRIVTWNVNGLRSLIQKDSLKQIFELEPDVICLQETKLSDEILPSNIIPSEYSVYHNISQCKGRYGVCIITKYQPIINITSRIGFEKFDEEGRYLCIELENNWKITSLYMPHGKRDRSEVPYKLKVANHILKILNNIESDRVILCTDFNIAHSSIDLARPSQNRYNTMFSNEERSIIDRLMSLGFSDVYRKLNGEKIEFTWWPYSFQSRERNIGWRIDYIFLNDKYTHLISKVSIKKDILGSDHCPVIMDIDIPFNK